MSDPIRDALEEMLGEFGSCEHKGCACVSCQIIRRARAALEASQTTGDEVTDADSAAPAPLS